MNHLKSSGKQATCLASQINGGSKVTLEDVYFELISVLDYQIIFQVHIKFGIIKYGRGSKYALVMLDLE